MAKNNVLRAVVVCFVACLFCSYQFMLQGSTSVMVPDLTRSLNLDFTQIGWVTSSFLYIYIICQIPGGMLSDPCDPRWLLTGCGILLALACYWFAHCEGYIEALMARALMGFATAPAIIACMGLVGRWFPQHWFPTLSGLVESMALIGGALGPLLLPTLIDSFGWRQTMELIALSGLALALMIALVVRRQPAIENVECNPKESVKPDYQWSLLFKNRDFWLYCLFGFGSCVVINTFAGLWGIPFIAHRFPEQERLAHYSVSLIFIGLAFGAPFFGWMATLYGRCSMVMLMSILLQMVLTLVIIYMDCPIHCVCCLCFTIGFVSGGYILVFSSLKSIVPESMTGVAMAMANGFMLLGAPVIQPMVGKCLQWLGEREGNVLTTGCFRTAFLLIFVCQFMALVCIGLYAMKRSGLKYVPTI